MHPPDRIALKKRVLSAGIWSLGGYGFNQLLRLGSNLLLTRLLDPKMFGVMAIATMVMVGLAMFSDLGLKPSVVQSRRGNDAAFLNTAWVTQILRGLLLWLLALIASLLIYCANHVGMVPTGTVYAEPILPFVVAILSITAVTAGFESTKLLEASRNLSLKLVVQIELSSQIIGMLCMLGWALVDHSIWALVGGAICSAVLRAILSHAWLPGTPNRWQWDNGAFYEIFHFGKWMFLSSVLGFLVNSGDRLLLGGLLSSATFGVYSIASLILNSIEQIPAKIAVDVSFPALSEVVRDRPTDFKSSYYRFHAVVASFAYICSGVLMTSGDSLIRFLYDPRYAEAGWMLEILAVALLTVPLRVATQSYLALGRPQLLSNVIAIRLAVLFVATPIGFYYFGIPGAMWGIVSSQFAYLPAIIWYNVKHTIFDLRTELYLLPIVAGGMGIGWLISIIIGV
jgi:O-antigen/teichoic acid export membrane protein